MTVPLTSSLSELMVSCRNSSPGAHQPLTSALVCCLQSSDGVQQPTSPNGEKAPIMLKLHWYCQSELTVFQTVFPALSIKRQQGALPVTVKIPGASSYSLIPNPGLHGKMPVSARRSSWDPRIFGAKTQGIPQMPATLLNQETSWNEKDY